MKRHVTEGSFFIGDDRTIFQIVDGRPEPVTYGGTLLKANGTMTAKRLAALIRIRDAARLVLQCQNDGWPEAHREEARRELNRHYDVFVQQYGLINKTTFSESATGTVIQRMPNLVKFIEDPDAMLVMALEDCDPTSGTAVKAAIMLRDVVGRAPPVTSVRSAEEGLLVSLDRKGEVDLGLIASLYGADEARVIEELGDLIYQDPVDQVVADGRRLPLGERPGEAQGRRGGGARVRPERRGLAGRAARGRAPGRDRREPRGPVGARERHPGVCGRALRRAALLDLRRAPEERRPLERRGGLRRGERASRRRPTTARPGPTGPRSSSRP